jgi:hypothetical protein
MPRNPRNSRRLPARAAARPGLPNSSDGAQWSDAIRGDISPRIAARPDPAQWGDDELLSLTEAAQLMWPLGPLTARSLRTAAEAGQLPVTLVARKLLTTKAALRELSRCATRTVPATNADSGANAARAGPCPRRRDDAYGRLMRRLEKGPA